MSPPRCAFLLSPTTKVLQTSFYKRVGVISERTRKPIPLKTRRIVCTKTPQGGDDSGGGKNESILESSSSVELPPEDKALAERLTEQERLRAAEKFVSVDEGNYVCINCGYLYEPAKGEKLCGVPAGTSFKDLDDMFACPACRSPKSKFRRKPKTIAGFAANQQYGIGVNSLTPGQKNFLIFGGLALFFFLLLSGYALD